MKDAEKTLEKIVLIIRTRGDPRPAVQAWSAELAREAIPCDILIASADDDPIDVPGGKLSKADLKLRLGEVSAHYGIPVYLFDKGPRDLFYNLLTASRPDMRLWANRLRQQRPLSYGGATNEGLLWAKARGADRAFFFDDDTRPIPDLDILRKHLDILQLKPALAVTGGYCGAHWLDVSFLPERWQQDHLAAHLMGQIPSGRAVQDSIRWGDFPQEQRCSWLIGGNCVLTETFFSRLCCPILNDTPSTDDLLLGLIGSRCFPSAIWKSDLPVIHAQAVGRKEPRQIQRYLWNWAQTVAFWAMLDEPCIKLLVSTIQGTPDTQPLILNERAAIRALRKFGNELAELTDGQASRETWEVMRTVANELMDEQQLPNQRILATVREGIREYLDLLRVWPRLLDAIDGSIARQISEAARC